MPDHSGQDKFWQAAPPSCPALLLPWLRDHGSLTQRIQQRSENFLVSQQRTGLARIAWDEAALLGLAPQQFSYAREVFLYADGVPVVFAHSACAPHHLRGAWKAIGGLGSQPLGALLFSHPLVNRTSLHYKALRNVHPLYQRAAIFLRQPPNKLWARRSLFYLRDAPLLVTEIFLPEILCLTRGTSR